MNTPNLQPLARAFCEKHYLELARDIAYPKILEAMQIGAAAMAKQFVSDMKECRDGIVEDRAAANRPNGI